MALKIFEHLVVGPIQCNCYIVGDPETKEAIIIDPGGDADDIIAAVETHGLKVVAAVATHAHFDHVMAAEEIRDRLGVPFYLNEEDFGILGSMRGRAKWFGIEIPPPPEVDRKYADDDELVAGSVKLGVVHTPGHTQGSVSLVAEDEAIFSGDTLFAQSIGRTDLPGGDYEQELASIKQRLFPLGDLPVFPGHGPPTSIAREKVDNPFVGTRSQIWTP